MIHLAFHVPISSYTELTLFMVSAKYPQTFGAEFPRNVDASERTPAFQEV